MLARALMFTAMWIAAGLVSDADQPKPSELPATFPGGRLVWQKAAVELHVDQMPEKRKLLMPRLNNRMKSLYVKGMTPEDSKLKFKPLLTQWEITLPKSVGESPVVVFETIEPIVFPSTPFVIQQEADQAIVLPAHHAVTHGELLRFEPQPAQEHGWLLGESQRLV